MINKILSCTIFMFVLTGVAMANLGDSFYGGNAAEDYNATQFFRVTSTYSAEISGEMVMGYPYSPKGIVNSVIPYMDVPTADSDTVKHVQISTATLAAGTSVWVTMTQMAWPVNVRVSFDDLAMTTMNVKGTMTIHGTDSRNIIRTEVILSSGNGVIYTSSYCYASIDYFIPYLQMNDSIARDSTYAGNMWVNIGNGGDLGLPCNVQLSTDVYKAVEAGSNVAVTAARVNTTYSRYCPATVPNSTNDYFLWIKNRGR